MKIIKEGKSYTKECEKCDCVFEYNMSDIIFHNCSLSHLHEENETKHIHCPWCGEQINIDIDMDKD